MKGGIQMPTKKKTSTKSKKKEEIFEEQLDNIEKNLDIAKKAQEEKKRIEKEEKERQKKLSAKIEVIRKDLQEQLLAQNKFRKTI